MNEVIDKAGVECRFRRSVDTYEDNAVVQKLIVGKLCRIFQENTGTVFGKVLEIGCGTGLLTSAIQRFIGGNEFFINDLVDEMCRKTANRCDIPATHCLSGDIEAFQLTDKYGLIISSSTFQWLARPAVTFKKLSDHLLPGGYLVFSTFGTDNLKEIREITGRGLEYHPVKEMRALLSPYFEILHTEEEFHTLDFPTPVEVLRHIKYTGVSVPDVPQIRTKGQMTRFAENYMERFGKEGHCTLTYHPTYWICRKKL